MGQQAPARIMLGEGRQQVDHTSRFDTDDRVAIPARRPQTSSWRIPGDAAPAVTTAFSPPNEEI